MVLALTFWDLFWGMIWLFFLFLWIWIYISIFSDLFRDREESAVKKVLWVLFLFVFPFLGPLIYLIVRGQGMAERSLKAQVAAQQQFDDYVRQVGGGRSPADELAKLAELKAAGSISEAEFEQLKAKVVSG